VLVTHEADIARYARRRILFRDGRIISDEPVTDRVRAHEARLSARLDAGAINVGIALTALRTNLMRSILTTSA
jgi:putative ABC transport system ATP-binding protein